MNFLNNNHEYKFNKLADEASLKSYDNERIALFYIISGNNDLFKKKEYIYNFKNNVAKIFYFKKLNVDFCTSSKSLIRLGFNLFNGYSDRYTNPLTLLYPLSGTNYNLAINAIKIRFEHF
jgi:hypothetical protein